MHYDFNKALLTEHFRRSTAVVYKCCFTPFILTKTDKSSGLGALAGNQCGVPA